MKKHMLISIAASAALLLTGLTTAATAAPAGPSAPTRAPLAGVRILMSNDDSMNVRPPAGDNRGLFEARKALCAAGADVVVVAPWANQSGVGTGVTNGGTFTVAERTVMPAGYESDCAGAPSAGKVFGVCKGTAPCGPTTPSATPADTVKFSLRGGLNALVGWAGEPDFVVSGINAGPNASSSVNDSGTVGAAIAASDDGVPAVALNAMFNAADPTLSVAPETYVATAQWSTQFITRMYQRGLLSGDYVVNVNYPDASGGKTPKKVKWAKVGLGTAALHTYTRQADSLTFSVSLQSCPGSEHCQPETRKNADLTLVSQGNITVSALTRDRTLLTNDANKLESFVTSGKAGK